MVGTAVDAEVMTEADMVAVIGADTAEEADTAAGTEAAEEVDTAEEAGTAVEEVTEAEAEAGTMMQGTIRGAKKKATIDFKYAASIYHITIDPGSSTLLSMTLCGRIIHLLRWS